MAEVLNSVLELVVNDLKRKKEVKGERQKKVLDFIKNYSYIKIIK